MLFASLMRCYGARTVSAVALNRWGLHSLQAPFWPTILPYTLFTSLINFPYPVVFLTSLSWINALLISSHALAIIP